MRALLIKTSSMGDVIHTLPAVSDAAAAVPGLAFDWVVERDFAPLCAAHPAVAEVIPVGLRRWRRDALAGAGLRSVTEDLRGFLGRLRRVRYDLVLDAQGLYKSLGIALMARGPRHGLDWRSAREPLVSLFYHRRHAASWEAHAIERLRRLFAGAFGYAVPAGPPCYGLEAARFPAPGLPGRYLVFAHGTSWANKLWPTEGWRALAAKALAHGFTVCLPAHGGRERARAEAIARDLPGVVVLPPLGLAEAAGVIARAAGVVALDTGLGHLAAALGVPSVTLYGPTAPRLTGTFGPAQRHLVAELDCVPCLARTCRLTTDHSGPAPCLAAVRAEAVWRLLAPALDLTAAG
ncbi:MAG: lipopolysaccharide heptosyltransferase I [Rhodospirillaceae bacterium]|nr:lipopolysaccharide heptosyltransferase I [Rhodospirillaceae bacterium]